MRRVSMSLMCFAVVRRSDLYRPTYIHVCVCLCVYIYIYIYIYMGGWARARTYVNIPMYAHTLAQMFCVV